MAQRSNPPRRVRRKVARDAYLIRGLANQVSDNDNDFKPRRRYVRKKAKGRPPTKKLLMCLDYGTTLTSISYIIFDPSDPPTDVHPSAIRCITRWPFASRTANATSPFVPSESWYRDGRLLWGHEVQHTLRSISEYDDVEAINRVVQLPKLLLDDDGDGSVDDPLFQSKQALRNVGKTARDAIRDYLIEVFKHVHHELETYEGFNDTLEVELALCVPSKWSTYAQLTMQEIMLKVVDETGMGGKEFKLFIIDEPEAAVTFALRHENISQNIEKGSNFVVCDAGGGTVDAITYNVRRESPFRFDEIAIPAGKDCGSIYINQALIEESRQRLAHITELGWEPTYSKEAVLQQCLFRVFENELKRNYDPADWEEGESRDLRIFGLKPDPARNFGNGMFFITKDQMNKYFKRSLDGTLALIREQLQQLKKDTEVKTLLLVGGFSRSPALWRCLNDAFQGRGLKVIHLDQDIDMTTAVSRGGILRALNKEDGPRRKTRLNLGVCVTEPYNPRFKGHREAPRYQPLNDREYVKNCMDWVIRKNQVLSEGQSAEIYMHRVFQPSQEMAAYETIYFSDQPISQHYRKSHIMNKGHRKAGVVQASLEVLREKNMLEENVNEEGDIYYEAHYSIRLEVNGRNVKASIHCPPGQDVQGETQICIAAAFSPGTD